MLENLLFFHLAKPFLIWFTHLKNKYIKIRLSLQNLKNKQTKKTVLRSHKHSKENNRDRETTERSSPDFIFLTFLSGLL